MKKFICLAWLLFAIIAPLHAQSFDSVRNAYITALMDNTTGDFGVNEQHGSLLFENGSTSHTNWLFQVGNNHQDTVLTNSATEWPILQTAGHIVADSVVAYPDSSIVAYYTQFGYLLRIRLHAVVGPSNNSGHIIIEWLSQKVDPSTTNKLIGVLWEADGCLNNNSACAGTGGDKPICLSSDGLAAQPDQTNNNVCWNSIQTAFSLGSDPDVPDYYHQASTYPDYTCPNCAFTYARLRGDSLTPPDEFYFGDWGNDQTGTGLGLKDVLWNVDATNFASGKPFADAAQLYKWTITLDSTRIATTYGDDDQDGDLLICEGTIFKEVHYTPAFSIDSAGVYTPPIDTIRFYAINVDHQLEAATNAQVKIDLTGSKHLYVVGDHGSLHGTDVLNFPNPTLGATSGEYVDIPLTVDTTTFPKLGAVDHDTIKLSLMYGNIPDNGETLCPFTILVPGKTPPHLDTIPPAANIISQSKNSITWDAHDSRSYDTGVDSITVISNTNYAVSIPPFTQCDTSARISITASVIDSTKAGCITIMLADCAHNDTLISQCYSPSHDTLPPIVRLDSESGSYFPNMQCNNRCFTYLVEDNRPTDFGLGMIQLTNTVNLSALTVNNGAAIIPHSPSVTAAFCIIDSLFNASGTLACTDFAGNVTDSAVSYCSIQDSTPPLINVKYTTSKKAHVVVTETRPWDRGLETVYLSPVSVNVKTVQPITISRDSAVFDIVPIDSNQTASFTVCAKDSFFVASPANKALYYAQDSLLHESCTERSFSGKDTLAPNLRIVQLSPDSARILVNDVHYNNKGVKDTLDTGVQSITVDTSNVVIDSLSDSVNVPLGCDTALAFKIRVRDTLIFCDTNAYANIIVTDCAGNTTQTTWNTPITPDTQPPLVTSTITNGVVNAVATDDRAYDRGLGKIDLSNLVNVAPYSNDASDGRKTTTFPITILDPTQPASATLTVTDRWGAYCNLPLKGKHTTVIPFSVSALTLALGNASVNENQNPSISLLNNGTFAGKNIDTITFQVHFDSTALNYVSYGGSAIANIVQLTSGTLQITLINTGGITDADGLPTLTFQSLFIPANSAIVPITVTDVIVNNGSPSTSFSADKKSFLLQPPPILSIAPGSITIQKTCDEIGGTTFGLNQNYPNPYSDATSIQYTIPGDGHVTLAIYDIFGDEVARPFNAAQTAGTHAIPFSSAHLNGGTYFYKLTAQCSECGHEYVAVKRMVIAR